MKKPHKYVNEITHWANGGDIQCQYKSDEKPEWIDYSLKEQPDFDDPGTKYRIKPTTKDLKYRVAIMQDDLDVPEYWPNTAFTDKEAKIIEGEGGFLKWLTDWKLVKDVEL